MAETNGRTLGARVRKARLERKLTQNQLAKEMDVSPGRISSMEQGKAVGKVLARAIETWLKEEPEDRALGGDLMPLVRAIVEADLPHLAADEAKKLFAAFADLEKHGVTMTAELVKQILAK